jgi:hypothetical protein
LNWFNLGCGFGGTVRLLTIVLNRLAGFIAYNADILMNGNVTSVPSISGNASKSVLYMKCNAATANTDDKNDISGNRKKAIKSLFCNL